MVAKKSELYFLFFLLIAVLAVTFYIFQPFLYALILAIVFRTVFDPLYRIILSGLRGRRGLAALFATLVVLIVIITPIAFISFQIFNEAVGVYFSLTRDGQGFSVSRIAQDAVDSLRDLFPIPEGFSIDINGYARQGLGWLLEHLGSFLSNTARLITGSFIFLIALYYLFKDGDWFRARLVAFSPLQDIHDREIIERLGIAINSVVRGNLIVAIVQGVLTALGFFLFGVPNAALWGSVAALAALIPGIGTALVLIPAIIFLFTVGETSSAIGFLIWGIVAVGLVDNFLGPQLAGRGARLHPFIALLSILGGLAFFGPLGFLLGPLTVSLLFALLDIYSSLRKEYTGL